MVKVAALVPADTSTRQYRLVAELAVRLGYVQAETTSPDPRERTAPNTIRAKFDTIASLSQLQPLDAASVAAMVAHGADPSPYSAVLLPDLSVFQGLGHMSRKVKQLAAWGVMVYVAPSPEPLNSNLQLIENLATFDDHTAERLALAKARADTAEHTADLRYQALYTARVEQLEAGLGLVKLMAPAVVSGGGSAALGAEAKAWRDRNGLTQKEVSARLQRLGADEGTSVSAVSRFEESGRSSVPLEIWFKLMSGEGAPGADVRTSPDTTAAAA